MKNIVNLLFEAKILKEIPRSGYHFLGSGHESISEHSFSTSFIALIMSKLEPSIDALKLISMCLMHDLPEARMGDLNYVQKMYSSTNEPKALNDMACNVPFGDDLIALVDEFNEGKSLEAQFARDADQLSLLLELKALLDQGQRGPEKWIPGIQKRLCTQIGKDIAHMITKTEWDEWWFTQLSNAQK